MKWFRDIVSIYMNGSADECVAPSISYGVRGG
jgi:hypothetical protein